MRTLGVFLALLGASSFLFQYFGRRSLIMSIFGDYERYAAIAFLVAGVVLFLLSFRKRKKEAAPGP